MEYNSASYSGGFTVTVASISAGWFKLTYEGWEGWISAEYVETVGTCA